MDLLNHNSLDGRRNNQEKGKNEFPLKKKLKLLKRKCIAQNVVKVVTIHIYVEKERKLKRLVFCLFVDCFLASFVISCLVLCDFEGGFFVILVFIGWFCVLLAGFINKPDNLVYYWLVFFLCGWFCVYHACEASGSQVEASQSQLTQGNTQLAKE